MKGIFFVICMCFVSFGVSAQVSESAFVNPENKYKPVPLWFWNNATVNENELLDQFRQMIRKDGYGGCAFLSGKTSSRNICQTIISIFIARL